jgi:hypothetical protein
MAWQGKFCWHVLQLFLQKALEFSRLMGGGSVHGERLTVLRDAERNMLLGRNPPRPMVENGSFLTFAGRMRLRDFDTLFLLVRRP